MRRWTPDEDARLRKLYGRHPTSTIRKSIRRLTGSDRTEKAIVERAFNLGLKPDIPQGYTRLVDAHDKNCRNHKAASVTIIRAATRAGVVKRAEHVQGRPLIAPTTWVDAWLEEHYRVELPAQEQAELDVLDWVSTPALARRLGLRPTNAADKLLRQRGRLRRIAATARRVRLTHQRGRPLYWHPDDADRIVREYLGERQLARAA